MPDLPPIDLALLDATPGALALLDERGRIAYANPAAGRLLGVDPHASVGESLGRLAGCGDDLSDGTKLPGRTERGHLELALAPLPNSPGWRVASLVDVTEVERARAREEAVLRTLDALGGAASVFAHEVKNPITAVNMALRALARGLGEQEEEVLQDFVQRLGGLERRLRRALDLARPLDLHPEPVPAEQLLQRAAAAAHPPEGVALEALAEPDAPAGEVDRALLLEALGHLVRNATEAAEGRILLRATASSTGDLLLHVEDDGAGIDAARRASAFLPFVTTQADHEGLGLAIARKIVEEHGGAISIGESALGGADVKVVVPASGPSRDN